MGLRYANYDIMECDRRSYKTRCFISGRFSVPKIRISIIVSLNLDVSIFLLKNDIRILQCGILHF